MARGSAPEPPTKRTTRILLPLIALVLTVGATTVFGPSAQAAPGVPDSLFLSSPGQLPTGTQVVLTASVFDDGFQPVDGVEVTFEVYRDGDRDGQVDAAAPSMSATDDTADDVDDDGDAVAENAGDATFDYAGPVTSADDTVVACIDTDADGCGDASDGFVELDPDDQVNDLRSVSWREAGVPASLFLDPSFGMLVVDVPTLMTATVNDEFFDQIAGATVTFEVYRDADLNGDIDATTPTLVADDDTGDDVDDDGDPADESDGEATFDYVGPATAADDTIASCIDTDADGCATVSGGSVALDPDDPAHDLASRTWRLEEPPVAVDDEATTSETRPVQIFVTGNDSDPNFDDLTVTVIDEPDGGTVECDEDGSCTYIPDIGFTGTDGFTYQVSDGNGGTDTAVVTIEVQPCPNLVDAIDDGGIATGQTWIACSAVDANGTVGAVTPVFTPVGADSGLLTSGDRDLVNQTNTSTGAGRSNDSDLRGAKDVSILRIDLDVPAGANCLAFDLAFMSEEYPEYVGSYNDAFLAELDVSDWSAIGNDIDAPGNFAFDQGGNVVSVNSSFFDPGRVITNTGIQYDGSTARLRAQTPITPGAHQLFLSIFDANDHILDSAAFVDGLVAGTSEDCEAGANQNPVAVDDDGLEVPEDGSLDIDVLDNDSDADEDPLGIAAVSDPPNGSAIVIDQGTADSSDDEIRYEPDADYVGPDSFTYTVSDGRGGLATATVSLTVTEVNDPPVPDGESATTGEGVPVEIDVATGDVAGPANESAQSLTYSVETQPGDGNVECTPAGLCTYTPDAGFSGEDSFTYEVCDDGTTDGSPDPKCTLATVTITVEETQEPVFTLSVTVQGEGSIASEDGGIACPPDCEETYDESTEVTLTATPDAGWTFGGWTGDCTQDPCVVTMDEDRDVTATFNEIPPPASVVSIGDTQVVEGAPGGTQTLVFTVSVSPAAGQQVTVPYAVVPGTATATQDYKPNGSPNSPLTFGPSETAKTISIPVIGDLLKEAHETLFVDIGPVTGATLGDARGQGTILNDDVCTIVGTSQANSIVGTPGDDHICGLGGDDVISPLGGNDVVDGGNGSDRVMYATAPGPVSGSLGSSITGWGTDQMIAIEDFRGSGFNDVVSGTDGPNVMEGLSGNDVFAGLGGNDTLEMGNGADLADGGSGRDRIEGGDGNDKAGVDDGLFGGAGDDSISGGNGDDRVLGGAGDDNVAGNAGNDIVRGGTGGDLGNGNAGIDSVYGEAGNDKIHGGPEGGNFLDGGPGTDLCSFGPPPLGDTRVNCEKPKAKSSANHASIAGVASVTLGW